jgi:hypothetical protein
MKSNYLRRLRALEERIATTEQIEWSLIFCAPIDKQKLKRGERVVTDYCFCGSTEHIRERITADPKDKGYCCCKPGEKLNGSKMLISDGGPLEEVTLPRRRPKNPDGSFYCWEEAARREEMAK